MPQQVYIIWMPINWIVRACWNAIFQAAGTNTGKDSSQDMARFDTSQFYDFGKPVTTQSWGTAGDVSSIWEGM